MNNEEGKLVQNARKKFLLPGEYYGTKLPCEIATLLGSCVSVCLYDRNLNIGAMNHYVLT